MRKPDREITDINEKFEVLEKCDTIRVAFNDEKYPYIVPMSYGCEIVDGKFVIYAHGAKVGKKHDLLMKNPYVCVETDSFKSYVELPKGGYTASYRSLIGFGKMEIVSGDEAVHGIELLMKHCGYDNFDGRSCVELSITEVFKITLDEITGKKRF